MDEVTSWQARALERICPIVSPDALVIKVQYDKRVINRSVHLAIGVREDGMKEAPLVLKFDPGLALVAAYRLSALDKKSRSTVNSPINVESGLMLSVRMGACAAAGWRGCS